MDIQIKDFIKNNTPLMYEMVKELCGIPAPSHFEHERAEYCKKWLEDVGAEGVYIDDALNVVFPLNCEGSNEITVFVAHTDTVFPDREPMPYYDDGERIHSPGAADDTASLVILMLMAKFFVENNLLPQKGIMFVCNSCEEGLGNLKGTRQLFKDYEGRIGRFISFDTALKSVSDRCVGSHRYEVEVLTDGGHSWGAFGKTNAIAILSHIVSQIYKIQVPEKEGRRTTYNVGTISGGTSINTIAQNAKMLCEYRSEDIECLEIMRNKFEEIFTSAQAEGIQVNVKKVGDRPCGNIDIAKIEDFKTIVVPVIEEIVGEKVMFKSMSSDCNIPLFLGVPALCVGVDTYFGIHTREEWVDKASMITGLEIAIKLGTKMMEG